MLYNIYDHISNTEFENFANRLSILEGKMSQFISPIGWQMTDSVINNDALIIDFVHDDKDFYGNMGLSYLDYPNQHQFNFYLTKSINLNDIVFFTKKVLYQNDLIFFEGNIPVVLADAMSTYYTWSKQYIIDNTSD